MGYGIMPRDTTSSKTTSDVAQVFTQADLKCSGGPTYILEATWAQQEINYVSSGTCNEKFDPGTAGTEGSGSGHKSSLLFM